MNLQTVHIYMDKKSQNLRPVDTSSTIINQIPYPPI